MAEQKNTAPRIIRREEVKHRTGLPYSSLYERVKAGTFPAPIRLGAGAKAAGWVEAEVIDWIAEQINKRDRVAGLTVQHPPYPATTKAGGFKFELDCERIIQSDTWALAAPCQRPLLLMLWFIAWQQTPCGSLPKDDMLNAARLGMEADAFQCDKAILLRGWAEADDGRLYHPVLTQLVLEMMDRKASNAQRQAAYRQRRLIARDSETNDKHRTDDVVTHYSGVSDDTTTTTNTTTITNESIPNGISTVSTRKSAKTLSVSDLVAEGVEQQHAEDWLTVRKARRAPLTRAAWDDVKTEAAKAAIAPAEAVRIAASSSWQGFKASWLASAKNASASTTHCSTNGTHGAYEKFDYGQGGAL